LAKGISLLIVFFASSLLFADDATAKNDTSVIPLLSYEYVSLDEQHYHNMRASVIYMRGDTNPPPDEERNSFVISGSYNAFVFTGNINDDYSDLYHKINITLVRKIKKHFILGSLSSASNEPLYTGGLRTAKTGLGYGYELTRNHNLTLVLGAIAWVGDFGIEIANGSPWPVMPIPIILFDFTSTWFNAYFEFFAEPLINITIAPEKKVRLTGIFRMDHYRDIQDLYFDVTVWHRFFSNEHRLGDFAGLGLGLKNNGIGFIFGENNKSYEMNYYSVYGILDLSFLQISGGYVFKGREVFNTTMPNDIENGFYVSAQLAWRF
jgi:hypothetical protein